MGIIPHSRLVYIEWSRIWKISPGMIDEQSVKSFHQINKQQRAKFGKVKGTNGLKFMMRYVMTLTKPGGKRHYEVTHKKKKNEI